MFPPLPPWEGLHVLVVHFPIALLMVAPLFVVAGLLCKEWRTPMFAAALGLMVLGTAGAYLAVATGEAAEHVMAKDRENSKVLHSHEEAAEKTRLVFTILTLAFAAIVAVPRFVKKPLHRAVVPGAAVVFLLGYAAGMALLANTAHHGGWLVHEFGVRAVLHAPGDEEHHHGEGTPHEHP